MLRDWCRSTGIVIRGFIGTHFGMVDQGDVVIQISLCHRIVCGIAPGFIGIKEGITIGIARWSTQYANWSVWHGIGHIDVTQTNGTVVFYGDVVVEYLSDTGCSHSACLYFIDI